MHNRESIFFDKKLIIYYFSRTYIQMKLNISIHE